MSCVNFFATHFTLLNESKIWAQKFRLVIILLLFFSENHDVDWYFKFLHLKIKKRSSCVPRICAEFYSIGGAYWFGFGHAWFHRKVLPGRNGWLVVVGSNRVWPRKVPGRGGSWDDCSGMFLTSAYFSMKFLWKTRPGLNQIHTPLLCFKTLHIF